MIETIELKHPIHVMYVNATSFPAGIVNAHKALHAIIPFSKERYYFGISRPENGKVEYRAAAQVLDTHEIEKFQLPTLIIPAGNYFAIRVLNYSQEPLRITAAFQKLINRPDIDQQGQCIEWYANEKDVICMVKMFVNEN